MSRSALCLFATAVLLAGCGGSPSPSASDASSAGRGSPMTAAATPGPGGSAAAETSGASSPAAGVAASAAPAGAPAGSTGASSKNGSAPSAFTEAGTYTYDSSGTVTAGAPRDASGTATLTVDQPAGGQQHSLLGTDQGRTEQTVVIRPAGRYLVRLVITNPAFSKDFRPTAPVLLVPDSAVAGRSWSWRATSTDGKTTAAVTAAVVRREVLTVGGVRTQTIVIDSTLRITGDVSYTGQLRTWYDPTHHLVAKEHTKGRGTFGGVQFTTDITSVLRSIRPR